MPQADVVVPEVACYAVLLREVLREPLAVVGSAEGVVAAMPHADVLATLGRDLARVEAPYEARVGTSFPTWR